MAISRSLSIQLDEQLYQRLIKAAGSRRLDTSEAAAQAIEAWVDIDAWHRAEIEAGLAEAERGDYRLRRRGGGGVRQMGEQPLGMKVVWLRRALRNLEDAATWIAQDNPPAAARLVARIKQATEQLASSSGRVAAWGG